MDRFFGVQIVAGQNTHGPNFTILKVNAGGAVSGMGDAIGHTVRRNCLTGEPIKGHSMTKTTVQLLERSIERRAIFGQAQSPEDALAARSITEMLSRRLSEKSENYDRAASRLELRGDRDSAQVLRKAAAKIRAITRPVEVDRD